MRSVAELSTEANNYNFSSSVSFRRWAHVLKSIKSRADHYASHGDYEDAYILYLRWADLILYKLPEHPEFESNKHKYDTLMKQLNPVLKSAEHTKQLLASRPETARPAYGPPSHSHTHAIAHAVNPLNVIKPLLKKEPEYDVTSVDMDTLRALKGEPKGGPKGHRQSAKHGSQSASRESTPTYSTPHYASRLAQSSHYPKTPPVATPRARTTGTPVGSPTGSPARSPARSPTPRAPVPLGSAPVAVPPTGSPPTHTVRSHTEGGSPLRTLFIPASMERKFLKIAEPNTRRKLETCGILCGKLNRNALFVTDLIIPHQENTENSCSTTNEEELFDYVEAKDLIILGWIHTHPTQSCFMSSVDLHTHNSYQLMLPEAVAIVCSPKFQEVGVFRLTDPNGVNIIKGCHRPGFHPHDEQGIYCIALPGHVRQHDYEFTAKDLR